MAREYGLPAVLRQFIETHHGTTLVEYFYNEAKKQYEEKETVDSAAPTESEFRYPGPKPRTIEAAIVMLADGVEGAVRTLPEATPTRIEAVVHNMAMKRLQDGQFDECDLTLRELNQIEASLAKALAAHYHSRIAYPIWSEGTEATEYQSEETDGP
jgi:membrane-associated HD superfamily phosphohydrolase